MVDVIKPSDGVKVEVDGAKGLDSKMADLSIADDAKRENTSGIDVGVC